jgi:hypothetical protein
MILLCSKFFLRSSNPGKSREIKDMASPVVQPIVTPSSRGWLRNGNPPGDYRAAPRCGARTRHNTCCAQPAMRNGRCRFHGGKSTGARTAAGRARCARAHRTHGFYSAETVALRREARAHLGRVRTMLAAAGARPSRLARAAGHGVLPSEIRRQKTEVRMRRAPSSPAGVPASAPGSNAFGLPTSGFLHRSPAGHGVLPSETGIQTPAPASVRLLTSVFRLLHRAARWLGLRA